LLSDLKIDVKPHKTSPHQSDSNVIIMTADHDVSSHNDNMPGWVSENEIDPQWIQFKTSLEGVTKCVIQDVSNSGRQGDAVCNGATLQTLKPQVTLSEDASILLVIKQIPVAGCPISQQLGLAQEALFYSQLAP
jgi:hypothetical protein